MSNPFAALHARAGHSESKLLSNRSLLALGLLLAGCSSTPNAASGQTGSPNNDEPPIYDTPVVPPPEGAPDGSTGEGGVGGGNDILPHRAPKEQPHRVEDTLLLGSDGLLIVDGNDPSVLLGRWGQGTQVEVVRADSLAEVAVVVYGPRDFAGDTIPEAPLSRQSIQLVVLDLSDPASPSERGRLELPLDTATVLGAGDGYTVVGGSTPREPRECGSYGEIGVFSYFYASDPWLRLVTWEGPELEVSDERHFETGYWELSGDERLVFLISGSVDSPELTGEVEVIDVPSLATAFSVNLPPAMLGTNWNSLTLDERNGVLLATGASAIFAFDSETGDELATLPLTTQPSSVRFLDDELAAVDGGGGLVRLDSSTSPPTVSWLPTVGGASIAGILQRFGDGFIELSATNENSSYLVTTLFDGNLDGGELQAQSQLTTEVPYRIEVGDAYSARRPWATDEQSGLLALVNDTYDEQSGQDSFRVMALAATNGQLQASDWHDVEGKYGQPLVEQQRIYYASPAGLEVLEATQDGSGLSLSVDEPIVVGLQDLWFEIEHAGYWIAKHRNNYGATRVSVRPSQDAGPTYVDVPYRTDAIVPLDDEHVAVLGLELPAECEIAAAKTGEAFAECGPGGSGEPQYNGISVVELGTEPRLVGSTQLSTFLGSPGPEGVERRIHWSGHLRLSDSELVLLAKVYEACRSTESCEALGVEPRVYEQSASGGGASSTPAGCAGDGCPEPEPEPEPEGPYVEGSRSSDWLVSVDLSDPTDPRIGEPVVGGLPDRLAQEFYRYGIAPWLLADGNLLAYTSQENLYDATGNSLRNENGDPIERHFVQLFEASADGLSFGEAINVPGTALLLGPPQWANDDQAEHSLFTFSGGYGDNGEAREELVRLSLRDGGAYVTERLALPRRAYSAVARGSRIVLLGAPLDYCADDAVFELSLIDASADELSVSEPLSLDYDGWGWHLAEWAPQPDDPDLLHLFGGPAQNNGRALIDVTGDVPEVIGYETFEW